MPKLIVPQVDIRIVSRENRMKASKEMSGETLWDKEIELLEEIALPLQEEGIITQKEEDAMLQAYRNATGGADSTLAYPVKTSVLINFLNSLSSIPMNHFDFNGTDPTGYEVSLYILVGKPDGERNFQGILEPVALIIPADGSDINHNGAKSLFPNHYTAIDLKARPYINQTTARRQIKNKDTIGGPPSEKIHFDIKLTKDFIQHATGSLYTLFQFVRSLSRNRLTLITMCSTDITGNPRIISSVTNRVGQVETGFVYDDHDLLP